MTPERCRASLRSQVRRRRVGKVAARPPRRLSEGACYAAPRYPLSLHAPFPPPGPLPALLPSSFTFPCRSLQEESGRIQASAQTKVVVLQRMRELSDYEAREAADLQVSGVRGAKGAIRPRWRCSSG